MCNSSKIFEDKFWQLIFPGNTVILTLYEGHAERKTDMQATIQNILHEDTKMYVYARMLLGFKLRFHQLITLGKVTSQIKAGSGNI